MVHSDSRIVDGRRVNIKLEYNHREFSREIAQYLLSLSYTDNASGATDDLQLSLEDSKQLWENDWVPAKGDVITATLVTKGFTGDTSEDELYLGFFEVDELELADPPHVATIKAVSAAISSALRGEENTKPWENIRLKNIAQEMADDAEMGLQYLAAYNPLYKRRDQTEQSNLAFLLDCCEKAGLALKVTNDDLVIFDEEDMESKEAVTTLKRGTSNILRARFKSKTRDIYRACEIKYKDPTTGQTFRHIYEPPNAPETGQLLKINERVEDAEEGKLLARKRLRDKNLKENMASMTIVGDTRLVAGVTVNVSGYGTFDGKYYIEKAKHGYGTGGYTVDLEMHKTMQSYMVNLSKTIVIEKKPRKYTRKGRKRRRHYYGGQNS